MGGSPELLPVIRPPCDFRLSNLWTVGGLLSVLYGMWQNIHSMNLRCPHYHVIYSVIIFVQGLVPTEEEQVELVSMNSPLLDAVPTTDDAFFTDDQQRPGIDIIDRKFSILHLVSTANFSQFPNIIDRRQVNLDLLPDSK